MRKYLKGLVLAGAVASAGCLSGNKKQETVRPVRPDEPRESRKVDDSKVPPSLSKLAPEEITEDNFDKYASGLKDEMDREIRAIERARRQSASTDK